MSTTPDAGTDPLRSALVGAGVIGTHHGRVIISELAGQTELVALPGQAENRVGLAKNRHSVSLIVGAYQSARIGQAVTLS